MHQPARLFCLAALLACSPAARTAAPMVAGCQLFPDDAVFNVRIDDTTRFPTHPSSAVWIGRIGSRALHLDFGRNEDQDAWNDPDNGYWGIPWNVVDGSHATTDWPTLSFSISDPRAGNGDGVPDESDCAVSTGGGFALVRGCHTLASGTARFPFPHEAELKAEYGHCNDAQTCGDRHVLVVEQGSCRLWESYFSYHIDHQWYAYSSAGWDLNSHALRPAGWTSGDAAGLPILPLLARVDEAQGGLIQHAFRVTLQDSLLDNTYTWPARHRAGGATATGIPFGSVMRLRRDFVIPAGWSVQARAIATAMQRYGLYVADIGSNMFVQGEPSAAWDESIWDELQSLQARDFEFVDLGAIRSHAQFDGDSLRVPAPLITADDGGPASGGAEPPPPSPDPGADQGGAAGAGCAAAGGRADGLLPVLVMAALLALQRRRRAGPPDTVQP